MVQKLNFFSKLIAFPIALIYGVIVWFRNRLFDFNILRSREFDIPVISVGNITVGGTGKTPHVEYIVELLGTEFEIATLSRGYKRKTIGFRHVTAESTPVEVGDEPCQIKRKFEKITVAVDAIRVRGIEKLQQHNPQLKAVILDDAYQHRYVKPGINILLVDFNRPIYEDHILPLGRLREYASDRDRADYIIVTKCPDTIKPIDQRLIEKRLKLYAYQTVLFTKMVYKEPKPVFPALKPAFSIDSFDEEKFAAVVVTAIAGNASYIDFLEKRFNVIKVLSYPDHYMFKATDIHSLIEVYSNIDHPKKVIITTEKDAMRFTTFDNLEDEVKRAMYYYPIGVEFLHGAEKMFNQQMISYVRNNKPDSLLHLSKNKKQA